MRMGMIEISQARQDAGIAAMKGAFKADHVRAALKKAGLTADDRMIERAADRIMQNCRRNGLIEAVENRNWRSVDPGADEENQP